MATAATKKRRHPNHLLNVAIGAGAPGDAGQPPMAARQMPPGMQMGMPPGGGPGGGPGPQGDPAHELADVIATLERAFPGNPKVAQIVADIRSLIAGGGPGAGPGNGAGV